MSSKALDRTCMKCRCIKDALLSAYEGFTLNISNCQHSFCEACFRNENKNNSIPKDKPRCPCCKAQFYNYFLTIEEAILFGEGCYLLYKFYFYKHHGWDRMCLHDINNQSIDKFEKALKVNRYNKASLLCLICSLNCGYIDFVTTDKNLTDINSVTMDHLHQVQVYTKKIYDACFDLFELCRSPDGRLVIDRLDNYYNILGGLFSGRENLAVAMRYHKLAYESCLRSNNHKHLASRKSDYLQSCTDFAKLPPLRFAVGDEVEFLHEIEAGSEWKLGKVVELYYHERSFNAHFVAPYRLQLLVGSDCADRPPVYAWVKADIDRYVRKVGVRSIEDTRFQARMDAKITELARVYCSTEFMHDIYRTLAQDHEFVEMLSSKWELELSVQLLYLYRIVVMYTQPLVRTNSGYHVHTADEVIAEIRVFFDPAEAVDLRTAFNILPGTVHSNVKRNKAFKVIILNQLCRPDLGIETFHFPDSNTCNEAALARAFTHYIDMYRDRETKRLSLDMSTLIDSGFRIPLPAQYRTPALNDLMSKVKDSNDLFLMDANAVSAGGVAVPELYAMWLAILLYIDNFESVCECPFVYFFIKYCLDQGMGVPKPAVALYDRMNMQLSREFIRCANPTCEINKLDKSTGKIKFKQCSRCKAVIYCSRECQTAHYPDHKMLCREHSTG